MDSIERIIFRFAIGLVFVGLFLAVVPNRPSNASWSETNDKSVHENSASSLAASDQEFIRNAAADSATEVELGRLALKKATNNDVRKYGQQMVDDHSKASDHLKQLATKKGLTLSARPMPAADTVKKRLSKFSGTQFDNAYMAEELKLHKQDVEAFRSQSRLTRDPELRGFITETLPILEDHLKKAEAIAPDLKAERLALRKSKAP
jgi:putative membrane protein